MSEHATESATESATKSATEGAAFPPLLRTLAVVLVVDLFAFGIWSLPSLRTAEWTTSALVVMAIAALCVVWVGYWIVYSRTRLEGDELVQTWLWDKRVKAQDVAQLKLVHIRMLERLIAPRLLVRRRMGGITWFHAYDPQVLIAFGQRVAELAVPSSSPVAAPAEAR
ncbi:hypothetical protein QTI51_03535 [Variovorax sp. J22G73]|uniref:hypothetical protein n=1 Tax=unclassified Variovorax TaxID=663243 RepID=UPI000D5F6522|nr:MULTISPECIES: hypothetical protein [unclassified Variovorax]MDM0004001.1 hypothetical protein [Variovorax sp. J22R203]MDM0096333.1 hypothetical protein [Variovorax sp. J22G73]